MKKLLTLIIFLTCFLGTTFSYQIQPGDNTLLSKVYDRIDEKMVTSYQELVVLEESMTYLMIRYGTSEKNRYFLTKINDYLRERLYRATSSSTFVCINDHVQNKDTVTISYQLTTDEGKKISLSKGEYTLQETAAILFNPGRGSLPTGVEEEILGMKMNEINGVVIPYREAYGAHAGGLRIDLPRQSLESLSETELKIDQRITMNIMVSGKVMKKEGFIKEIGTESVLVDFNKPLAGHDLMGMITVDGLFKHCQETK